MSRRKRAETAPAMGDGSEVAATLYEDQNEELDLDPAKELPIGRRSPLDCCFFAKRFSPQKSPAAAAATAAPLLLLLLSEAVEIRDWGIEMEMEMEIEIEGEGEGEGELGSTE